MSSMAALALRLAAVQLLKDATIAEDRVFDSALTPIDSMVREGATSTFIVVSTGDEEGEHRGRDILSSESRWVDLYIEAAVATAAKFEEFGLRVPQTDANLEMSIAILLRQITRALFDASDGSAWAEVFRAFTFNVLKSTSRRGMTDENGSTFAARQLVLRIQPADEPMFGAEPEGVWQMLMAALEGDDEFAPLAPVIRATMVGEAIPETQREIVEGFLTREGALAIDVGPLPGSIEDPDRFPPFTSTRFER